MVEYDREDLVSGRVRWRELTPEKWREADEQALAELAATGICKPFEKEYFRKDGSRVPVLVGAALLQGTPDEGVGFVLDLTERKRAEDALRRSEAYLAEAQRISHTGSFRWTIATGEILWSEETFRILQYAPTTNPTLDLVLQRVHPKDKVGVREAMERVSRYGKDEDYEHRLLMPDGSIKHIRVLIHAEREKSGELDIDGAVRVVGRLGELLPLDDSMESHLRSIDRSSLDSIQKFAIQEVERYFDLKRKGHIKAEYDMTVVRHDLISERILRII